MSYYHVCFAVQDIEQAMADMTSALGLAWREPRRHRLGSWEYDLTFSADGPPFVELIAGPPGSPWDATAGSGFHHIGFWSPDVAADKLSLDGRGAGIEFDGCPYGRAFTYHRVAGIGARVELLDVSLQAGFRDTWGFGGIEMPVHDVGGSDRDGRGDRGDG